MVLWNSSKLWAKYYQGIQTAHQAGPGGKKWKSGGDEELAKVVSAVQAATNFDGGGAKKKQRTHTVEVGPSIGPS